MRCHVRRSEFNEARSRFDVLWGLLGTARALFGSATFVQQWSMTLRAPHANFDSTAPEIKNRHTRGVGKFPLFLDGVI